MKTKIIRGKVLVGTVVVEHGDDNDIISTSSPELLILVEGSEEPILFSQCVDSAFQGEAKYFKYLSSAKSQVSLKYHLTTEQVPADELDENFMNKLMGRLSANYGHHCSDLTGYLWTDNVLTINNHDVVYEILHIMSGYMYRSEEDLQYYGDYRYEIQRYNQLISPIEMWIHMEFTTNE